MATRKQGGREKPGRESHLSSPPLTSPLSTSSKQAHLLRIQRIHQLTLLSNRLQSPTSEHIRCPGQFSFTAQQSDSYLSMLSSVNRVLYAPGSALGSGDPVSCDLIKCDGMARTVHSGPFPSHSLWSLMNAALNVLFILGWMLKENCFPISYA